jgi:hypothetical protein
MRTGRFDRASGKRMDAGNGKKSAPPNACS